MAHPFAKLFTKALTKSTPLNNLVYQTAKQIIERGYPLTEVDAVLIDLAHGRLDEAECALIAEARVELANDIADPSDEASF